MSDEDLKVQRLKFNPQNADIPNEEEASPTKEDNTSESLFSDRGDAVDGLADISQAISDQETARALQRAVQQGFAGTTSYNLEQGFNTFGASSYVRSYDYTRMLDEIILNNYGLSEEELNKIFKKVSGMRIEEYRQQKAQGKGLDMAQISETAERHETVNYESQHAAYTDEAIRVVAGYSTDKKEEEKNGVQDNYEQILKKEGAISWALNGTIYLCGGTTRGDVQDAIKEEAAEIKELREIAEKGDMKAFMKRYKELTGVDFRIDNMVKVIRTELPYNLACQAKHMQQVKETLIKEEKTNYNQAAVYAPYGMSVPENKANYALDHFVNGTKYWGKSAAEKRLSPLETALWQTYKDNSTCLDWIETKTKELGLKDKTPEERYKALVQEFIKNAQGIEDKVFEKKTFEEYEKDYKDALKSAFGRNIPQDKLDAYVANQATAKGLMNMAILIGAGMFAGPAALTAIVGSISTLEKMTDGDGMRMSGEEMLGIGTEMAITYVGFKGFEFASNAVASGFKTIKPLTDLSQSPMFNYFTKNNISPKVAAFLTKEASSAVGGFVAGEITGTTGAIISGEYDIAKIAKEGFSSGVSGATFALTFGALHEAVSTIKAARATKAEMKKAQNNLIKALQQEKDPTLIKFAETLEKEGLSKELLSKIHRQAAKIHHPDIGGNPQVMSDYNNLISALQKKINSVSAKKGPATEPQTPQQTGTAETAIVPTGKAPSFVLKPALEFKPSTKSAPDLVPATKQAEKVKTPYPPPQTKVTPSDIYDKISGPCSIDDLATIARGINEGIINEHLLRQYKASALINMIETFDFKVQNGILGVEKIDLSQVQKNISPQEAAKKAIQMDLQDTDYANGELEKTFENLFDNNTYTRLIAYNKLPYSVKKYMLFNNAEVVKEILDTVNPGEIKTTKDYEKCNLEIQKAQRQRKVQEFLKSNCKPSSEALKIEGEFAPGKVHKVTLQDEDSVLILFDRKNFDSAYLEKVKNCIEFSFRVNEYGEKELVLPYEQYIYDTCSAAEAAQKADIIGFAAGDDTVYDFDGNPMTGENKKHALGRLGNNLLLNRSQLHAIRSAAINFNGARDISKILRETQDFSEIVSEYKKLIFGDKQLSPEAQEVLEAKVRFTLKNIQLIDKELSRVKPNLFPRTYYSGVRVNSGDNAILLSAKEGDIIVPDAGFRFASRDISVARCYTYSQDDIILEIHTSPGVQVSKLPDNQNQVLFKRNTKYKVIGKKIDTSGRTILVLKMLSSNPTPVKSVKTSHTTKVTGNKDAITRMLSAKKISIEKMLEKKASEQQNTQLSEPDASEEVVKTRIKKLKDATPVASKIISSTKNTADKENSPIFSDEKIQSLAKTEVSFDRALKVAKLYEKDSILTEHDIETALSISDEEFSKVELLKANKDKFGSYFYISHMLEIIRTPGAFERAQKLINPPQDKTTLSERDRYTAEILKNSRSETQDLLCMDDETFNKFMRLRNIKRTKRSSLFNAERKVSVFSVRECVKLATKDAATYNRVLELVKHFGDEQELDSYDYEEIAAQENCLERAKVVKDILDKYPADDKNSLSGTFLTNIISEQDLFNAFIKYSSIKNSNGTPHYSLDNIIDIIRIIAKDKSLLNETLDLFNSEFKDKHLRMDISTCKELIEAKHKDKAVFDRAIELSSLKDEEGRSLIAPHRLLKFAESDEITNRVMELAKFHVYDSLMEEFISDDKLYPRALKFAGYKTQLYSTVLNMYNIKDILSDDEIYKNFVTYADKLLDKNGFLICKREDDIRVLFREEEHCKRAIEVLGIQDITGKKIFTEDPLLNAQNVLEIATYGNDETLEKAKYLAALTNKDGQPLLNPDKVADLSQDNSGTVIETIKMLQDKGVKIPNQHMLIEFFSECQQLDGEKLFEELIQTQIADKNIDPTLAFAMVACHCDLGDFRPLLELEAQKGVEIFTLNDKLELLSSFSWKSDKDIKEFIDKLIKISNNSEVPPKHILSVINGKFDAKAYSKLLHKIGRDAAEALSRTDALIACKFVDFANVNNINEIPLAAKRPLLRSLVSANSDMFSVSDKVKEMFPMLPKNEKEYCTLLPQIVRSIGITTRELTPEQRIIIFNEAMGELGSSLAKISDSDFANIEITQEYSKDKFIKDVLEKVKDLSKEERQKVYDYFGFELHHNKTTSTGFSITGYPVNLNNGAKLAQITESSTKAVVESLRPDVIRFSENNPVHCTNKEIEPLLNEIVDALPELRTAIGRRQHGTHEFDVFQHSLKVMQKISQDPQFALLNQSDKKVMLLASLLHDITKAEGYRDKLHASESGFDAFYIAKKFKLSPDEHTKLTNLVKYHEWLEYANTAKTPEEAQHRIQSIAFDMQNGNLFDMAEIFTHADLRGVKADGRFHDATGYGQKATDYGKQIRVYINELKASQPILPQTEIPKAEKIRQAITTVNPDGSTNIKGVYVTEEGRVIISYDQVEDWEAIGFPKGSISRGITSAEDINTGNIKFFVHGLDNPEQLVRFDAFSLNDSDALLSVSYAERPESKYRFFRPQGVILKASPDTIYGGGETDAGSGCQKSIKTFKEGYVFGGYRQKDRTFVADLIKQATGMSDAEYVKFREANIGKAPNEIEPAEIRDKIIKALATINSRTRRGGREYNEMYLSNPEVEGVFIYPTEHHVLDCSPIEFLKKTSDRFGFLSDYAQERDLPIIIFGETTNPSTAEAQAKIVARNKAKRLSDAAKAQTGTDYSQKFKFDGVAIITDGKYNPKVGKQIEKIILKWADDNPNLQEYKIEELKKLIPNLDYKHLERHLRNLKTFVGLTSNYFMQTLKNGYFSSKEGLDAFDILSKIYSEKDYTGQVSSLSNPLGEYRPETVLKAKERNLLGELDKSKRITKLTAMSDTQYADLLKMTEQIIQKTGHTYEELVTELKTKLKPILSEYHLDRLFKLYVNRESVTAQLELLNYMKDYPCKTGSSSIYELLAETDISNVESIKNVLNKLKTITNVSLQDVEIVAKYANKETEHTLLELLKNKEIEASQTLKIYSKIVQEVKGGKISQADIINEFNNNPLVKTIRAIKSDKTNLTPPGTIPTALDPENIDSSAIVLVHMTEYEPTGGKILSTRDKIGGSRASVHFTINHPVASHRAGDWSDLQYAIISPFESVVNANGKGKIIEGRPNDIYSSGSVNLPEGTIIVKLNPDIEKGTIKISDFPDKKGIRILETSEHPHSIVPAVLEKMGYTYTRADGLFGQFSHGKYSGKTADEATVNFKAWKRFCDNNGLKPTSHTYSPTGLAENLIERMDLLSVKGSWVINGKNYLKDILNDIKRIKYWQKQGYFVSYDIDKLADIVKHSKTPNSALIRVREELGFHQSVERNFFSSSNNELWENPLEETIEATLSEKKLKIFMEKQQQNNEKHDL